ncbi:hypothetical protein B0H13DRAFT_1971899 [Mycena leptocephala]|nr:hypothetical protein B0H13DRAFT_1971899 [Mycena leptocephala]
MGTDSSRLASIVVVIKFLFQDCDSKTTRIYHFGYRTGTLKGYGCGEATTPLHFRNVACSLLPSAASAGRSRTTPSLVDDHPPYRSDNNPPHRHRTPRRPPTLSGIPGKDPPCPHAGTRAVCGDGHRKRPKHAEGKERTKERCVSASGEGGGRRKDKLTRKDEHRLEFFF